MAAGEGEAHALLGGGRRAVAGRAPEQDVGDVEAAVAREPDRAHHAVHQLAAHADERLAEPILVGARRLAHDHHRRARRAVGEHRVLGGALQRAALEAADRRLELGQCAAALGQRARILDELRRFERHRPARRGRRRRRRAQRCRRAGAAGAIGVAAAVRGEEAAARRSDRSAPRRSPRRRLARRTSAAGRRAPSIIPGSS